MLSAGAVHAALTDAGLRGQTDIVVDAADVLDVHTAAMTLASGASAIVPWLAIELAAELAGTRGAEDVTPEAAIVNLLRAFEAGLRKVLARMGISTATSYLGGQLFEILELQPEVTSAASRPRPHGPAPSASRPSPRASCGGSPAPRSRRPGVKLVDPGWARFRADGERHMYAPTIVKAIQELAGARPRRRRGHARTTGRRSIATRPRSATSWTWCAPPSRATCPRSRPPRPSCGASWAPP